MKQFKSIITLNRNKRGCYILDTVKGCSYTKGHPNGCYDNCYAKMIADRYRLEFSNPVTREFDIDNSQIYFPGFKDRKHENKLVDEIAAIEMPFVRIGEMGDPSEDWEHTIGVCRVIKNSDKPIVIITKHWHTIPANLIPELGRCSICINTSISAMDTKEEIKHRLWQYKLLSSYCKSVLRVVTCNFGRPEKKELQDKLLSEARVIDTVFRPSKNNPLVVNGEILVDKVQFLDKSLLASKHADVYMGSCDKCPDMCGINV